MSWLSQAFSGDWGGLENAVATTTPKSFFSDTGKDVSKALSNPLVDAGLLAGAAFLAPYALPALGEVGAGLFGVPTASEGILGAMATPSLASATEAAAGGALGFAGDVGAESGAGGLEAFLANPAGAAGGGLPGNALALTGPESMGAGGDLSAAEAFAQGIPVGGGGGAGGGVPASLGDFSFADAVPGLSGGGAAPPWATTAGMSATPPAEPGFWSSLGSQMSPTNLGTGLGKALSNPMTDIGLAGLGYNMYQGYESKKALENLAKTEAGYQASAAQTAAQEQQMAQPLFSKGETLMNFLATNKLPKEFDAQIAQQMNAARARIISGYASRGMSVDPKQNSALVQDLNSLDQQAMEMRSKLEQTLATEGQQMVAQANQLLNSGLNATQLASQIPLMMQKLQIELNNQTASALSTFASALGGTGGGGKTVQLKLA